MAGLGESRTDLALLGRELDKVLRRIGCTGERVDLERVRLFAVLAAGGTNGAGGKAKIEASQQGMCTTYSEHFSAESGTAGEGYHTAQPFKAWGIFILVR